MELINDRYWKHWEEKRIAEDDGRPPMPKELPHTCNDQVIYNPPWLWSNIKGRYVPNFASYSKFITSSKPKEYDGSIE